MIEIRIGPLVISRKRLCPICGQAGEKIKKRVDEITEQGRTRKRDKGYECQKCGPFWGIKIL